jgi:putative heme-binding domain-containing protein
MKILLLAALMLAPTDETEWKAGVASVKITPEAPVPLAGYASRTQPFAGILADVHAKALALEDGGGRRAVVVTSDLVGFQAAVAEPICERIRERTGLRREQLLLTASHTHTGPAIGFDADDPRTVAYTQVLRDKIASLVETALGRLEPARLSWGSGFAPFVMNRREVTPRGMILGVNPRGPVDRSVPALRVASSDGKTKAVLFGAACHNTTLDGNFTVLSGDYAGFAQAHVEEKLPGVQAMFLMGCGGDANPHPRKAVDAARAHGATLGAEVVRLVESTLQPVRGPLRVAFQRASLPFEPAATTEELERNLQEAPRYRRGVLEQQLAARRIGKAPPTHYEAPFAVWQFGQDLTLVGLPGEAVVDYVPVVEQSIGPLRLWIAAYCNDVFGYLPSDRILREGGYEARGVIYGDAGFFAPATQDVVARTVRTLAERAGRTAFTITPGFRIDLVASEPDVRSPVAMAFDEDGRIYVAEMTDYPVGPPAGRVTLLEDRDGDGRVDRARVFADRIPFPTGVLPWRGGVLVTAAPDIWFFKDTDGDGRADVREAVFTGFTEGNTQHRVNGLQFGIDNRIYGTNGGSGGEVRRGSGPGPGVSIGGRDFRFRPDYAGFEAIAGRGQFGNTFDDWGNRFINDNSNHIRHPVLPLNYLARNPHLAVAAVEEAISDHGTGRFTSACSVTLYRGEAFCCEPVRNLVHRDVLVPKGASFTARRADEPSEFLSSSDPRFRPVNLCAGPDGSLYVIDMRRDVIEHPQWIPLDVQRRVDLRAGWDEGRIYRVTPEGGPTVARPRMSRQSAEDLVGHLQNPNIWWRSTAQRLLIERQEKGAVAPLRQLARASTSATARLHALWTLEGLNAIDEADLLPGLKDVEAGVREHALRLAEPRLAGSAALRKAVLDLATDPSPRVRFQFAFTLGVLRDDRALDALVSVLLKDGEDRWTRVAALSSMRDSAAGVLARLPSDVLERAEPATLELVRQLGDQVTASRDETQIAAWLRTATEGATTPARWRLVALSSLAPILRRGGVKLPEWNAGFLEAAFDPSRDVAERVGAIDMLSLYGRAPLEKLLQPREPVQVQVAAVKALGTDGAAALLDRWPSTTAPVRREVLAACLAKPATTERVVDRLERGEIRGVELAPHHKEALLRNPSAAVRERVQKALASKSDDREQVLQEIWGKVSTLRGDGVAGEKVYQTGCSTCHRLRGEGFDVGPSLSSVAGRDKRALLTDILDPNRAVAPQYQVYLVKIPGSRDPVSGIVAAETPTSLTLRRANAEETLVLRRDILEIKAWPASLMPDGIESTLTAQNFADLLEFLHGGGQK